MGRNGNSPASAALLSRRSRPASTDPNGHVDPTWASGRGHTCTRRAKTCRRLLLRTTNLVWHTVAAAELGGGPFLPLRREDDRRRARGRPFSLAFLLGWRSGRGRGCFGYGNILVRHGRRSGWKIQRAFFGNFIGGGMGIARADGTCTGV